MQKDNRGGITSLYIALSGNVPLTIPPGGNHQTTLNYTTAIQEDSNRSKVAVTLTAGREVTLGGCRSRAKATAPLTSRWFRRPRLACQPRRLSIDFVGRRTVLNDGQTLNCVTFALTNMTDGIAI